MHVTKTRKNEQGTSTGNRKMKSGNKLRELEMKFLIGLGFKLGFVPIFNFSVPFRTRSPLPVPHISNIQFSSGHVKWGV